MVLLEVIYKTRETAIYRPVFPKEMISKRLDLLLYFTPLYYTEL